MRGSPSGTERAQQVLCELNQARSNSNDRPHEGRACGGRCPLRALTPGWVGPLEHEQPALEAFFAEAKPIYYRSERIYCRTVGEALMAMMYREGKWKVDYRDDWNAWWELNRTYYRH